MSIGVICTKAQHSNASAWIGRPGASSSAILYPFFILIHFSYPISIPIQRSSHDFLHGSNLILLVVLERSVISNTSYYMEEELEPFLYTGKELQFIHSSFGSSRETPRRESHVK